MTCQLGKVVQHGAISSFMKREKSSPLGIRDHANHSHMNVIKLSSDVAYKLLGVSSYLVK
ncbi:CLUMA_CG019400, isoform A [Clunio marinus]|uniref:CLUMA_CG019400, isoform A n=1 Tax=Clunio marinus TaxID=568069 RepID=A0A1J1J0Z8_9DIPT|nr:CLUMA_CG019400, isoform A [Clunio marinus]